MFAPDVRPCQPNLMAQEVAQEEARVFDGVGAGLVVDGEGDLDHKCTLVGNQSVSRIPSLSDVAAQAKMATTIKIANNATLTMFLRKGECDQFRSNSINNPATTG